MSEPITRRTALKLLATATMVGASARSASAATARSASAPVPDPWSRTHNRVWLGGEFAANPMENWQIAAAIAPD